MKKMKKLLGCMGIALVAFTTFSFSKIDSTELVTQKEIINVQEVSPLSKAVVQGDLELVKKIIDYGVNINEESNDMTPLMYAARYNKLEIIKYLISKGAEVNKTNSKGFSALKYAKLSNAVESIDYLQKV